MDNLEGQRHVSAMRDIVQKFHGGNPQALANQHLFLG